MAGRSAGVGELSGLEGGGGGVDEVLRLLLHPLLVVELDVLLVLAARAVRLAHGRRVVGEVGVAVVAEVLRHREKARRDLEPVWEELKVGC